PIARTIRAARPPVTVIFRDDQPAWNFAVMELADEVAPGTALQLLGDDALPSRTIAGGTALLLDPSDRLLQQTRAAGLRGKELYRQVNPSDDLGSLRRAAQRTRASDGYLEAPSSLWLIVPKR
ncbi:MAG: hypothetical protein M3Y55_13195, partial [Pseudomonadota bacterium]|nr:hypothetical protein [Pseudomonadota bacterium]